VLLNPWDGDRNGQVSQIIGTNISTRLDQYLNIFPNDLDEQQLVAELRKKIIEIKDSDIKTFVLNKWASLESLYHKFEDKFADNYAQFFGLCLFLSIASKMRYSDARELLKTELFAKISLL
jgi:hypothetical protein